MTNIKWHPTDPDDPEAPDGLQVVRDRWADAPASDDDLLELLAVARTECEAYAPKETDPEHPGSDACRAAQLMQARNIWNAGAVQPSGGFGDEHGGFSYSAWPLDRDVKQRLRPKRAVPWVG